MFEMKKKLLWSKLKAGLVITVALFTLFMTVFFAGSIENLFSPKFHLKVQIPNVKGLRGGAPVWVSGIEVGSVKELDLSREYGTIVHLSVDRDVMGFIKKDSRASVLTMGLLGDKYIELTTGSPGAESLHEGDIIQGNAQIEFQDIMETSATSIEKLSELITRIEKSEGTLAKFLTDPEVYNNLTDSTEKLSLLLGDIRDSKGTVMMLLKDPSLYNDLKATVSSLEDLSRTVNESSGTFKKLVEDPALYDRLLSASISLEKFGKEINESRGTFRKLVEDPVLYDNLSSATEKLTIILQDIDKGKGVAGTLVNDEELARELKETIAELRKLTSDIKDHPKKYFKFSIF
jgi:phospholipid/cholesterol/gamma-HCH transport system substrate-binding protein